MQRLIFAKLSLLILIAITISSCGGQATAAPQQVELSNTPDVEADVSTEEDTSTDEASTGTTEDTDIPTINLPEVIPSDNPGGVVSAGSSTVFPLAEAIAELYEGEGGGNITIDSIGSGAGFERFCVAGETDVSNASRPIKDSEIESCQSIGRDPIEFRVGTDAVAVTVSAENNFVSNVTMDELAAIFSTAVQWSDVRPDWPDQDIQLYIPGTDSGTFDFFVEEVFDEDPEPMLNANNVQLSEDDNVLVQGILGSPYAIGFFGYAYYVENVGSLNILSIDDVVANDATVDSGEYALARPLFIYSDASIMQEKPQVAAYINFFLTHVNDVIVDVGYFPANPSGLELAKLEWLNAMK